MAKSLLFVGNLPYSTTDDQLREVFAQAGNVVSATVAMDPRNGNSRGFGFVEMGSPEEAATAISQLNGTEVEGRKIFVDEKRESAPRDRDSRGPRRGGFGGGRDRGGFGHRDHGDGSY